MKGTDLIWWALMFSIYGLILFIYDWQFWLALVAVVLIIYANEKKKEEYYEHSIS